MKHLPRAPLAAAFALALAAAPALAQYKVVGPDGKVTYTDRAPSSGEGRVVPLGAKAQAIAAAEPELPFELRGIASRYPVTLYTIAGACEACTIGRNMLRQRGVPFTEKLVVGAEDSEALERLSGGREAPTVTIGGQTLRGYAPDTWGAYLDAAGYPKDSKLPASYAWKPATPIVQKAEPARAEARAAPTPPSPSPTPAPAGNAAGIRF